MFQKTQLKPRESRKISSLSLACSPDALRATAGSRNTPSERQTPRGAPSPSATLGSTPEQAGGDDHYTQRAPKPTQADTAIISRDSGFAPGQTIPPSRPPAGKQSMWSSHRASRRRGAMAGQPRRDRVTTLGKVAAGRVKINHRRLARRRLWFWHHQLARVSTKTKRSQVAGESMPAAWTSSPVLLLARPAQRALCAAKPTARTRCECDKRWNS